MRSILCFNIYGNLKNRMQTAIIAPEIGPLGIKQKIKLPVGIREVW